MAFDTIWEEVHSTRVWGAYPSEPVIRFVARNYYRVADRSSVRILDFGCGGGAHTWYLSREGFSTYAFDGSKSAALNVEKRLMAEGLPADIKVLDGINITSQYNNNYFDAVIDNVSSCANRINDIITMYSGMFKILKPAGKLFSSVFSVDTTGYGLGTEVEPNTYTDIPIGHLSGIGVQHFFTENELRSILESCGFTSITIEPLKYVDCGSIVSQFIAIATKPL